MTNQEESSDHSFPKPLPFLLLEKLKTVEAIVIINKRDCEGRNTGEDQDKKKKQKPTPHTYTSVSAKPDISFS